MKLLDALIRQIAAVATADIDNYSADGTDPRFAPLAGAHRLAYAVLVACTRDHRRNEGYFCSGALRAGPGEPEEGRFLDFVISEVSEALGAPELLTCLIANNLDLITTIVDKPMVMRFSSFVNRHGPRADLQRILSATLSCNGKAVEEVQEMVATYVYGDPDVRKRTFLETTWRLPRAGALEPWPLPAKGPVPDEPFLGEDERRKGFSPVCVRWISEGDWSAMNDEALFYGPDQLGAQDLGDGWVRLDQLARELDDDAHRRAIDAAGDDAECLARVARRRQLAGYYVEQIRMLALICQDRSYNAICMLEREYSFGLCVWCVVSPAFPAPLKAAFAALLLALHVDRSPHRPKCGLPVLPQEAWVAEKLKPAADPLQSGPAARMIRPDAGRSTPRRRRGAGAAPELARTATARRTLTRGPQLF